MIPNHSTLHLPPTAPTFYTPCPENKVPLFFCCNFYKYWRIFIIFMHNFARECQSHWHKNLLPHIRYVATIPCESLWHKSNRFHTNISTLHMFISITFRATSIEKTNKIYQKVRGSKFMFEMSTIHANTCIQTTMPLRNSCRDDGVHASSSLHSLSRRSFNFQRSFNSHHGSTSGRHSLETHPRAVVHRIQIWRIRWPHLWRDKRWRLSL